MENLSELEFNKIKIKLEEHVTDLYLLNLIDTLSNEDVKNLFSNGRYKQRFESIGRKYRSF
jgi:hypothetical protein